MSFVQQLGRVTGSARDNFVQETLERLMAKCEEDAAQGRRKSTLELDKPEYFHELRPALEQRLRAMGFALHDIWAPTRYQGREVVVFRIHVEWKVESPGPEDVLWQQGTHQFRQSGVTRAPKALPW